MKLNRISSFTSRMFLHQWSDKIRSDIEKTRFEATTGRHYNMSESIGYKVGNLTDIAEQKSKYKAYKDSNNVIGNKLDFIQKSINSLFNADKNHPGAYQNFIAILLAQPSASNINAVKASANVLMGAFMSSINGVFDGQYVFGGQNNDTPPLKDLNKAVDAIKEAYRNFLKGKSPDLADGKDITNFFKSKEFNSFFEGDKWSKYFSNATDEKTQNRISEAGETVDETSSVNLFKNAIKSLMMVQTVSSFKMTSSAHTTLVNIAGKLAVGAGSLDFTNSQMMIGVSQNRLKQMDDFYNSRLKVLANADADLGGVDQEEATMHEQALEASLNISLKLTARLAQITLLNYI